MQNIPVIQKKQNGVQSHVTWQDGNPAEQSDIIQHVLWMTSHFIFIRTITFCSLLVDLCSHGNIWMEMESDFQWPQEKLKQVAQRATIAHLRASMS